MGDTKRRIRPMRHNRAPCPLLMIDPAKLDDAASRLLTRIKTIHRNNGSTTCVYVDGLRAYAISEEHSQARQWAEQRFHWLVGIYDGGAEHAGLLDDLEAHLA